jgi:hypothetical protein
VKIPLMLAAATLVACAPAHADNPWHYNIVTVNFWIGQVIDPHASDGSQKISAYDPHWEANYGGCDGILKGDVCTFEYRSAANDYFPTQMTPKQNPFYMDLPLSDRSLKDRWVQLEGAGGTCYGQVEDAGPAVYDDSAYVLGSARPKNTRFNGAGMDISPALYGCLGHSGAVAGASDRVNWRFVDADAVPAGPWTRIIT